MDEFENLYQAHFSKVFAYAWHCVGRREIAEEITSEAFIALFKNRERIDQSRLPAWLFTVVKNRAVDYWRHLNLEKRVVETPEVEPAQTDDSLERFFLDAGCLNPLHRGCLILRYVHGMERHEIAQQTGLTENQVKHCLQYALEQLRKTFNVEPK